MLYILDTADTEAIRRCNDYYPVAGVTTNPTIISKENRPFLPLIREIRSIIGDKKMLHIQVTAHKAEDILNEAKALRDAVGETLYIKVPVSPDGLRATMMLKEEGFRVTETAIFTQQQALIAAKAGADFVAPYVNRLDNIVSDGVNVVAEIVEMFRSYSLDTKVLAASFKTVEQVHKIAMVGGHAVTVNPDILEKLVYHPLTLYAIDDFEADWQAVYGKKGICDLVKE